MNSIILYFEYLSYWIVTFFLVRDLKISKGYVRIYYRVSVFREIYSMGHILKFELVTYIYVEIW